MSKAKEYNVEKGNWHDVYETDTDSRPSKISTEPEYSSGGLGNESGEDSGKEFREIEKNTIVADIDMIPDSKTSAKKTIRLEGLGLNLTGLYYVDKVTRTWSKDNGFSQSMTVSRNAFGDSIKRGFKPQLTQPTPPPPVRDNPRVVVTPKIEPRIHIVQSGDSLWSIALKYYNNGNLYTKIAEANNIAKSDYNQVKVGKKLIIP